MFETIEELECVTGNRCIEGVFFWLFLMENYVIYKGVHFYVLLWLLKLTFFLLLSFQNHVSFFCSNIFPEVLYVFDVIIEWKKH